MGVRTLLSALKDRFDGKSFEVWEEASGEIQAYQNGNPLVEAETNPVTGGVGKLNVGANEIGVALVSSRSETQIRPVGVMALSPTPLICRHGVYLLPGVQWDAYRVRVHNAHTQAVDYKVAVVTLSALGGGVYNAETWDKPTFGGSLTGTIPAGSGVSPQWTEGILDSDVMFTPSADYSGGTILAVRTYCAVANNTRFNPPGGVVGGTLSGNKFLSSYLTGVDAVADTSLYLGQTSIDALPPVSIIGYSSKQIRKIGLFGASTLAGQADGVQLGWAYRAQTLLNTGLSVTQFVNNSMPGSKTSVCLSRAIARINAGDVLDDAMFNIVSVNDSTDADYGTPEYLNRLKGQIVLFVDTCRKYGVRPWLATFQSVTGMTGVMYAHVKEINAYARTLRDNGFCGVFDIAGLFSDEAASVGTWKDTSLTTDGTHPNTAGTVALANYAVTVFA